MDEDPDALVIDALTIVAGFDTLDMDRTRKAILFWLHLGELDGQTGRRLRDFTRNHLQHAGRAYAAAQYVGDAGLINTPAGWNTGTPISLTHHGRLCVEQYGGDVADCLKNSPPPTQPSVTVGDIGDGAAVSIGNGNAAASGDHSTAIAGSNNHQNIQNLDHADLVALLGRTRPYLSSFHGGGELVDELMKQAASEEDTPELRRTVRDRIKAFAGPLGILGSIASILSLFGG